jgi:large subunit ribosomal protein L10
MNRQQKEATITDLRSRFGNAQATFLVNYRGLTVTQMQELRRQLREKQASVRVAKARLMKIAADDLAGSDALQLYLKDQIALIFAQHDISSVAKQVVNFARENEALQVVAGYYESSVISEEVVRQLASLPSREILLAQLVGVLHGTVAGVPRVLHMLLLKLLLVLKAIEEQKRA